MIHGLSNSDNAHDLSYPASTNLSQYLAQVKQSK